MLAAFVAAAVWLTAATAPAGTLKVELNPASGNPANPQMGDQLSFHSAITNAGEQSVDGVMAWISLLKVDPGREQPVDLEDWSAQKAVTRATLPPGGTLEVDWPMRLIQDGHYRVVVSVASRGGDLAIGPLAGFSVRAKPVVESSRILPVAFGIPLLIGAFLLRRTGAFPTLSALRQRWRSIYR
jgi:hypothetical protein